METGTPLTDLKGVGEALAKKLAVLGLKTVDDLIIFYPRRYEDYSELTPVGNIRPGAVTIKVFIKQATGRYVRRGMHITEAAASDDSGSVRLVWFNQPYRASSLKSDEEYFVSGNFEYGRGRLSIMNPSVELASDFPVNTARILPVYKLTKGLTVKQVRKIIGQLVPQMRELAETLPDWLIAEHGLMSYAEAVETMHFPASADKLAEAKRRLGFEEVFELSLASLLNKKALQTEKSPSVPFDQKVAQDFVSSLPFQLTNAQRKSVWQIYRDMAGDHGLSRAHASTMQGASEQRTEPYERYGEGAAQLATPQSAANTSRVASSASKQAGVVRVAQPMNRLVEGDVGSGKTAVAAMAALMVMHSGHQVALMAPTEILARQHGETLQKLLEPLGQGAKVGLLVGSMKPDQKKRAHERIASGDIQFIIGTHALIQEKVDLKNLELIIIDEQHRFGVEQRKKLMKKAGHMPHVLSLTATPIPRSLALTLFGELDISILDEKPPGRKSIITEIISPNSRAQMDAKIKRELDNGRQMFVVCPLISESGVLDASSAEQTYERLSKKDFKNYKIGLLHGRMKSDDKNSVMQDFVDRKLDILVSTTVIEVGVDVPNANVMLIESPERFGLAQIHQLRGRVGRGAEQSFCYLVLSDSKKPSRRLRALETSDDGFKLAELDLELRGPGAIYGALQHGQLDLRIAQLTDVKLIASAKKSAEEFIARGENLLKYKQLSGNVASLQAVTNLN